MTQEQKVIRAKVGVLELAKQLGNVSQACRVMGYSRKSDCPNQVCSLKMRISENGILGHSGSEQIGIDRRRTGFVSSRDGCVEPSADARDVLFLQAERPFSPNQSTCFGLSDERGTPSILCGGEDRMRAEEIGKLGL